jgi:hypothetical protein
MRRRPIEYNRFQVDLQTSVYKALSDLFNAEERILRVMLERSARDLAIAERENLERARVLADIQRRDEQ